MKILHVIRDLSPSSGGPVAAIKSLAQTQKRRGDEVVVVATNYGSPQIGEATEFSPHYVLCPCNVDLLRYSWRLKAELARWVAWCDVVHIHVLWEYPTLAAVRLARKLRKPFLLRPCGMLDNWSMSQSRWKKRIYLALFSETLFSPPCVLHFTTEAERNKSVVVSGRDAVVVGNGVAPEVFEPHSKDLFLEQFPDLKGRQIILFLGRLHAKKKPDLAIEAFASLAERYPETTLVLVGPCEDDYVEDLKALAASLGLGSRTRFIGLLQGPVLYSAYRSATIFLLPSRQENFGIAVVEAMAAGCPVIVSPYVDIHSEIESNGAGLVCELQVQLLVAAIEEIIEQPDRAVSMGLRGQETAKRLFSWDVAAARLNEVYSELIQKVSA